VRNVGKRGGRESPSQAWITAQLIELAEAGNVVARLKGGDPLLFARGAEEAEDLAAAGINFEIVPGVSSPVAASAYAGISLTHRDLSSSVTFITGSDREGVEWTADAWERLATATDTICVLMGMRRIQEITRALIDGGRSPETPTAVVQWAARPEQRVLVSTLAEVTDAARREGLTNPAVIIVGEVVRLRNRLRWYDAQPLFGKRVLVPRPAHQARDTASAIRERGAEPVIFPVIEIFDPPDPEPFAAALRNLARYDWVLFTSANGVERAFLRLGKEGRDARAFGSARVGAIGPGTKAALLARGIAPDAVASEFVGEGLARTILERGVKRALVLRARVARDALPDLLRKGGAEVDVVAAYETRRASSAKAAELIRLFSSGGIDAVLFTSSSTVDGVVELLGDYAKELLSRVTLASIGPVTSETVKKHGLTPDVVATEFTVVGLLEALSAHYASAS
jgi:uroporphyrinogen III methyltransferase/synthase